MNDQQDRFNDALKLHRSGRIQEAIGLYADILLVQQNDARLLYLLGVANLQIGRKELGLEQIERSLAINPRNPAAHYNIGVTHHESGRLDEALASYDKALAIDPDFAEAHYNRGIVLRDSKRWNEALENFDRAIVIKPDNAEAHCNRGATLQELKRPNEALANYDKALALNPEYLEAHYNRGSVLQDLKRLDEALASYDRALSVDSGYANAHNNRGNVLRELGRRNEALASYSNALAINPNYAEAYSNRGNALRELMRWEEALSDYDKALAIRPEYSDAYCYRAIALQELKRLDEALKNYDMALTRNPNNATACWNKSLLLILVGRYLEGWSLYEWRLRQDDIKDAHYTFPQPSWRGEKNIRGKKLLIYAEQGLGDVIQFCRYLHEIRALDVELLVEVPECLVTLVSTLDCPMSIVAKGVQLPTFDAYCPLASLPYVFKTTIETIPAETPYLFSDARKVQVWREKLGKKERLRIGLVWAGAEKHKNDLNRSIKLREFLGLTDRLFIEWHSLQKEYRPDDIEILKRHPEIRQHQNDIHDFSDTAALTECMDLVISVDTSVAHVAGAMGKPVWILLPFFPDSRWMLDRDDSPWYPTARLYRQAKFGDWQTVITSVHQDLVKQAARPGSKKPF